MERSNPLKLFFALLGILLVWGGAGWLHDGFYLAKHEGDAVHLIEILLRMDAGQVPHRDFMTPIGAFAFQPIVWFMTDSTGVGAAFIRAQIAIAAFLLPAVWWLGSTRLALWQGIALGAVITVLCTAFVHGELEPTLSVSMHYNRWAWALAFVGILPALLPAQTARTASVDGVIVGTAFALLLLIKVTYVAALAPAVLIALLVQSKWRMLLTAVLSALVILAVFSILSGFGFWIAYLVDILTVTASESRPNPGMSFREVIASPAYVGGSLTLLASVIFLRQAGQMSAGLILLLLVPGFFYVTYQNFGNDPQWLYLLPLLLLALRPAKGVENGLGWDMRTALTTTAVIAAALAAPSFLNLAYSPFRHLSADVEKYRPLLRGDTVNDDILALAPRAYASGHTTEAFQPGGPMEAYAAELDEWPTSGELAGEALPRCQLASGVVAYFDAVAVELAAQGYSGSAILGADVFSTIYWVYGDFEPVKRGAPWSYGTDAGIENADFFLVPICPLAQSTRKEIVEAVEARSDISLTEVYRGELFILLSVTRG